MKTLNKYINEVLVKQNLKFNDEYLEYSEMLDGPDAIYVEYNGGIFFIKNHELYMLNIDDEDLSDGLSEMSLNMDKATDKWAKTHSDKDFKTIYQELVDLHVIDNFNNEHCFKEWNGWPPQFIKDNTKYDFQNMRFKLLYK